MHVLHVSKPTTEGVAVVVDGYVRDQLRRGFEVDVACPADGWLADSVAAAGATVLDWPATRNPGPATIGETRRLRRLVMERDPDVLHLHSAKAGLAGRLAVRGTRPTVFQPHAWSYLAARGPLRRLTLGWERVAARWTDAWILVSEAERAAGEAVRLGDRAYVVPNGVDLRAWTPATEEEHVRARRYLAPGAGSLVVCVGRLAEQKGQRDLVEHWPEVTARVPDAVLVLVGDGPLRDEIEKRLPPNVNVVGNRSDVADWYAAADVVVAPSRWEGMALAPIEAMARGRYVVATDVAGMREVLGPDSGAVVPVADPSALTTAIANALTDDDARIRASRAGRERVESRYDAGRAAAAVVDVYRQLLEPARESVPVADVATASAADVPAPNSRELLVAMLDVLRAAHAVAVADGSDETARSATTVPPSRPRLARSASLLAPKPARPWSWWRWRAGLLLVLLELGSLAGSWALTAAPSWPGGICLVVLVALVVGQRLELHRPRLELSVLEEVPELLGLAAAVLATTVAAAALRSAHDVDFGSSFAAAGVFLGLLGGSRVAIFSLGRSLRLTGQLTHPVILIGGGEIADRLGAALRTHREYGLRPVGLIDPLAGLVPGHRPVHSATLRHLGGLAALPAALVRHGVRDVIFAFSDAPDAEMVRIVRALVRLDCQVFIVPRFYELYGSDRRARIEVVRGVPLVRLRRWPLRPSRSLIKRGTDVALAGAALLMTSPVLAVCALAVRMEGGPGVIFKQVRVGRDGRPFTLYKFRSMRPADETEQAVRWSIDGDDRIGPVGRVLRRAGLDELPQLVNILRGDMSFVGPRPERPFFASAFGEAVARYRDRSRAPSGLTGLAQVNGLRGDTSITERVTLDNHYIDTWTFWSDVKIIIRTVRTVFRREPSGGSVESVVELSARPAGDSVTPPISSTRPAK